jgi:hypothetical protein
VQLAQASFVLGTQSPLDLLGQHALTLRTLHRINARVALWNSKQQSLCVRMLRVSDDILAGAFLNDLAILHHRNAVAYVMNDRHVMADEEVTQSELVLQIR